MTQITTLAEVSAVLEARWPSRATKHRMSLDSMREFMEYLGNPQDSYAALHVAGTSGKTSTAYYAAALLHAAGHRVGLTVSPHVDTVNERVQIAMQPLAAADYVAEMNTFLDVVERSNFQPTYFELLQAFAFWEFARQRVEYAVIEVGVGGALDSSNVMNRSDKVSILTDIGFDHMNILGNTLPEIAAQKAGIIPTHGVVFCWQQADEVLDVFRGAAQQKQGDLHVMQTPHLGSAYAFLPLFQRRNFELARAAVRYVLQRDNHPALRAAQSLEAAHIAIPARMEIRKYQGKSVILDASHNPQKLHALVQSVQDLFPDKKVAVLVGFARSSTPENRTTAGIAELLPLASHLLITGFTVNRVRPHASIDPLVMSAACQKAGYTSYETSPDPVKAFAKLLSRPEPVVVVTGSFFLLNVIRPLLTDRAE